MTSFNLLICLFFFKQKTAYEMRISDWSSDVCSSDLCSHGAAAAPCEQGVGIVGAQDLDVGHEQVGVALDRRGLLAERRRIGDRTSVVSGKSVSGRVDRGGCRIIKKKTKR